MFDPTLCSAVSGPGFPARPYFPVGQLYWPGHELPGLVTREVPLAACKAACDGSPYCIGCLCWGQEVNCTPQGDYEGTKAIDMTTNLLTLYLATTRTPEGPLPPAPAPAA